MPATLAAQFSNPAGRLLGPSLVLLSLLPPTLIPRLQQLLHVCGGWAGKPIFSPGPALANTIKSIIVAVAISTYVALMLDSSLLFGLAWPSLSYRS